MRQVRKMNKDKLFLPGNPIGGSTAGSVQSIAYKR